MKALLKKNRKLAKKLTFLQKKVEEYREEEK